MPRNVCRGDERISIKRPKQIEIARQEDFVMFETQQASMDSFAVTDDVKLVIAAAPTVQRRIVKRLCAEETASVPPEKTAP